MNNQSIEQYVNNIIENSYLAQKTFEMVNNEIIDDLITDIVNSFSDNLSYWAVEEFHSSKIGNINDKIHKLGLVTKNIYNDIHKEVMNGFLAEGTNLLEYASPVGIIFGIVPLTNPVPNSLFKILLSLKTKNSLVLSFPRKASELGVRVIETVIQSIKKFNLPENIIQVIDVPSRDCSQMIMESKKVSLILATGGSSLVHQANKSGQPVFGVGPGNVPVFIGNSADLKLAAKNIVDGKKYDNGIVCGSESNIIISKNNYIDFVKYLELNNSLIFSGEELDKIIYKIFDKDSLNLKPEYIGLDANKILDKIGYKYDSYVSIIVLRDLNNKYSFIYNEKLVPILSISTVEDSSGIELAQRLIQKGGRGHTAVIHSNDEIEIQEFAAKLDAGRIFINMPATHGMLGITSYLPLSFMQGSGTWGKNTSTAPLTWRDLVNIKRVSVPR